MTTPPLNKSRKTPKRTRKSSKPMFKTATSLQSVIDKAVLNNPRMAIKERLRQEIGINSYDVQNGKVSKNPKQQALYRTIIKAEEALLASFIEKALDGTYNASFAMFYLKCRCGGRDGNNNSNLESNEDYENDRNF